MAKWDERPHVAYLKLAAENGMVEDSVPISKRQYEACKTLETQKQNDRLNPIYEERVKRWLMMDLRRYRRHLGHSSLGAIIPVEQIEIMRVRSRQLELFQGDGR